MSSWLTKITLASLALLIFMISVSPLAVNAVDGPLGTYQGQTTPNLSGKTCTIKGGQFFGFPHWWKYLDSETDVNGDCSPKFKFPDDIWKVALAVIDMLLYLAGIAAVVFIIIAGVTYMLAEGNSEKAAAARKRILSAVIGLVIVLTATVFVRFVGNQFGG